jgi:hypothetical protein
MNVTIKEASKKLGIKTGAIYYLLRCDKIKALRGPTKVNLYAVAKALRKNYTRKKNITRFQKSNDCLTKRQKQMIAKIKQIIFLREKGETFDSIGKKFGMSRQAVHFQYKKYKNDKNYR